MATRSFLTSEELKQLPLNEWQKPQGGHDWHKFSLWLGEKLFQRLTQYPGWEQARPIALGSWSRDQLCPKSDIDLIFVGPEKIVQQVVDQSARDGLKLRYRVPADINDWSVGVEPFDVLALLHGRAFSQEAELLLEEQKNKIRQRGEPFAKELLTAMLEERQGRTQRYDSISNYLEPNIKFGPGGLRDLQQALYISELFPHRYSPDSYALKVLREARGFFVGVRQKLNLQGGSDVIVATEQKELAQWFGSADSQQFMRDVQRNLSRVSFYADWVVAQAKASPQKLKKIEAIPVKNAAQAFAALEKDPSILMQARVRTRILELFGTNNRLSRVQIGKLLSQYFHVEQKEEFLLALFRSRVMENCLPELKPLEGLVQHDQYHRYSADAHVLQSVREVVRVHRKPKTLGKLAPLIKELSKADWSVLLWSAVFHDIAKGRKGDHSTLGAKIVQNDFAEMELSERLTSDVAWLVENHLLLSTASFRRNPQSPTTWKELLDRGVKDKRLLQLGVFTAVDIRATNPEAWNEWKESLLAQMVEVLRSPRVAKYTQLLSAAGKQHVEIKKDFLKGLDPGLVEELPLKELLEDYKRLQKAKKDLPVLLVKAGPSQYWVRFHRRKDRAGLFRSFTQTLFASSCRIQHAAIHTFDTYGVYDWFKVVSDKKKDQLKKLFELVQDSEIVPPKVRFDSIKLVSQDDEECTISFRGRDQRGALIAAADALHSQGLVIRWARVHTWGRQIDDIFGVRKPVDIDGVVARLRLHYQQPFEQNLV